LGREQAKTNGYKKSSKACFATKSHWAKLSNCIIILAKYVIYLISVFFFILLLFHVSFSQFNDKLLLKLNVKDINNILKLRYTAK